MAEESYSEFVKSIQVSLRDGNTIDALKIFSDNKNSSEVKNNSWDLVPVISQYLTIHHGRSNANVFKCCVQLINIIAHNSNPEEVLLQFIEEIEESVDDTKFITLLGPLREILFRIPNKRVNALAWSFNAIQSYIKKCDIPEDVNIVGKEKLLLDSDENVQRITNLYSELLIFYDSCIADLETNSEGVQEYVGIICKFLIDLLGKPLACLDMEVFDGIKSKRRLIAENLVQKILKVIKDPCLLLETRFQCAVDKFKQPSTLGVSVLFYLVHSEGICIDNVPKVYSPVYFFQLSLHLCTSLLEVDNHMCTEKALSLALALLNRVKYIKLSYLLLDSEDHCKFCMALAEVIVYNDLESMRKSALSIYQTYINSFEIRGFYLLVYNLVSVLSHAGLIGFTITQYKDQLAEEFLKNEQNMSVYLKGPKLLKLLEKFCYLHKNEESDLIEVSDQIIATLNLLRYLVLRDKNNVTDIRNYFELLEEIYFKPLRKGIELSKAHYDLKVKELEEETASGDKNKSKSKISVTVGGQSLLEMSKNEKLKVLHSSLIAFDVMDSLLSRVIECIELCRH